MTETQPVAPAEVGATPSERPAPTFDGHAVRVSVQPDTVGPIELDVGPLRSAPESDSHPWIQHEVRFLNGGDRIVSFDDTRTSVFLRRAGEPMLLVADEGCGYGKPRKKPVEPGVCAEYLDVLELRPGSADARTITLFKDLRGMGELTAGSYTWDRVIRFRVGGAHAPVRRATIRLTYEVSPAGG